MSRPVSQAQTRELFDYWRPRLTPEWSVALTFPKSLDASGQADRSGKGYLSADIQIGPGFATGWAGDSWTETLGWTDPLLRVEAIVVHELLHLTLHDLQDVSDRTHPHFTRQEWAIVKGEHDKHLERVLDRLAFALVAERHGFDPVTGPR